MLKNSLRVTEVFRLYPEINRALPSNYNDYGYYTYRLAICDLGKIAARNAHVFRA